MKGPLKLRCRWQPIPVRVKALLNVTLECSIGEL
jgi:hypothetical protein